MSAAWICSGCRPPFGGGAEFLTPGETQCHDCLVSSGGTLVAAFYGMAIVSKLRQFAGRRVTRRLYRSMPWIGSVLAIVTLGKAVRRKGFIGGTVDTALDFIPFVGGVKNVAEMRRGRDFIPDRTIAPRGK
jgi:hypothetical protein